MYGGQIVKDGHELGFCLCVVYVDDILLLSTTKEAEEHVVATLSSVVSVNHWRDRRRGRLIDLIGLSVISRNLCQMKHIHASGRHWGNCSGCRR